MDSYQSNFTFDLPTPAVQCFKFQSKRPAFALSARVCFCCILTSLMLIEFKSMDKEPLPYNFNILDNCLFSIFDVIFLRRNESIRKTKFAFDRVSDLKYNA